MLSVRSSLRIGACAAALVLALAGSACLKANPEFVENSSTGTIPAPTGSPAADDPAESTGEGDDGGASETDAAASAGSSSGAEPIDTSSTGDGDLACDAQVGLEATPIELGQVDPGSGGRLLTGQLDGEYVETWARFESVASFSQHRVAATISPMNDYELCAFVECVPSIMGVVGFANCDFEYEDAESPAGRPGCCGGADVRMDYFCPSQSETAELRLRLRSLATAGECRDYQIGFEVSTP
jgi:hypothetical protein